MKAAFLVSYLRTKTFHGISRYLDADIYWISTGDPYWIEWLKEEGVPASRILDLSGDYPEPDMDALAELEINTPFTAAGIIMSDRILSTKTRDVSYAYLCGAYKRVKDFITENEIRALFGESTWAAELAASAAAEACGAVYLTPATTRIPNGRFTFFKGPLQERLFFDDELTSDDLKEGEEFYREFCEHRPKPDYSSTRRDFRLLSWSNIAKLMKHLNYEFRFGGRDMTRPSLNMLFETKIFRRNNAKRFRRMRLKTDLSVLDGLKYAVYFLHVQPEASIDVLGAYHSDQFALISDIARSLPSDMVLVVKEHPQGVGDRVREFYNALIGMPNVILVHPESDSYELISGAERVYTVTGTVAYQAGLMGIPAVTFSDMFFNKLPMVERCRCREDLINFTPVKGGNSPEKCSAFLARIIKNSFEGSVYGEDVSETGEDDYRMAAEGFKKAMERVYS
ncbi:hypothetical protein [Limisalsivibrio acetivorans]|uniref:hypothetical protein n=1 Tax=Limisalsivibrio acetivorans TaxID=1304888 RepID=UPI0003B6AA47|nr:hypothetical protein [Limisalsivibrio acetivorans]